MKFRELPDQQSKDLNRVYEILRRHNAESNSTFWAKFTDPANEKSPLNIGCYQGEEIVGGLIADTQMSWLKIHILAVEETYRFQGVGRRLIETAEQVALQRGCKYAFLDTMETQSPRFYEKCGFIQAGRIEDWDSHGHAKYFFSKSLLAAV